jgi:hypothetical protein
MWHSFSFNLMVAFLAESITFGTPSQKGEADHSFSGFLRIPISFVIISFVAKLFNIEIERTDVIESGHRDLLPEDFTVMLQSKMHSESDEHTLVTLSGLSGD